MKDDDRSTLGTLLRPLDEATFLREYWGRKPALLRVEDAGRLDGLFCLDDLENYLFVGRPAAGELQVIRNGEWAPVRRIAGLFPGGAYDLQAIHSALAEGFTIVLNAVHARWPAVRRLVDGVEHGLLARSQVNVYVTGPRGQGFAVHTDDHDVFVLQTAGTKRWQIYDRGGAAADPLFDVEVRRGDVVYLPIGFPHAAQTSDDISMHLSLGVFPLTRQALAHDVVNLLAGHDAWWREPVPLAQVRGDEPVTGAEMAARIGESLAALNDLAPILEAYRRGLDSTARRKNPAPSGYLASLGALEHLAIDDEVERRPGIECVVTTTGDRAAIHFMGETIHAPIRADRALRFIAATRRFRVRDVDDTWSDSSKIVLVRRLVREGLLQVDAARPQTQ